jgi:nicotinamidase/pyrazinamidase
MARGSYDEKTALVVVDVQNDFADPDGSLYVSDGETIVEEINEEIRAAIDAGAFVAYTQDWHPESTPHFEKDGGVWPVHCVEETWGAEFHPDLTVEGEVVRKGTDGGDGYSGFSVRDPESGEESATRLGAMLEEHGIETVVVVGLAQDYCVKETAIDAASKGYQTILLGDLTRAVEMESGDGDRAVKEMESVGVTVN